MRDYVVVVDGCPYFVQAANPVAAGIAARRKARG